MGVICYLYILQEYHLERRNSFLSKTNHKVNFINRKFLLLWIGQTISVFGDYIFDTTLTLWIATSLARGQSWAPLAVSGLLIAVAIPTLIFGPIAGVFADRWNKRLTMLRMDALRAFLIVSLLALPLFKDSVPLLGELGIIYIVVFCNTLCAQFFDPSRFTLISDIVEEAQRTRASGMSQLSSNLAIVIGPALAAPLFFAAGVYWALIVNALSFVASLLCILAIQITEPKSSKASDDKMPRGVRHFLYEFGEGLHFCLQNRSLLTVVVTALIFALGGGLSNAVFVFFVTENLHVPTPLYGMITTALGLGCILGALLATFVAGRIGSTRSFWLSMILTGIFFLILGRLTSFPVALVIEFLIGIPITTLYAMVGPIIMQVTPRRLLGRVIGVLTPGQSLFNMIAIAISGTLASTLLRGFHVVILGITFGTYDTLFTMAGFLILSGGIYAMVNLRRYALAPATDEQ